MDVKDSLASAIIEPQDSLTLDSDHHSRLLVDPLPETKPTAKTDSPSKKKGKIKLIISFSVIYQIEAVVEKAQMCLFIFFLKLFEVLLD